MKLRVRFAETDQMGVAHHSAYAVWFEAARVEWLRQRGLNYRELEESGLSLAVTRLSVEYRRAAYFDDELSVRCELMSARSRQLLLSYEITREGELIATGTTEHLPTDRSGRARTLPPEWLTPLVAARSKK